LIFVVIYFSLNLVQTWIDLFSNCQDAYKGGLIRLRSFFLHPYSNSENYTYGLMYTKAYKAKSYPDSYVTKSDQCNVKQTARLLESNKIRSMFAQQTAKLQNQLNVYDKHSITIGQLCNKIRSMQCETDS